MSENNAARIVQSMRNEGAKFNPPSPLVGEVLEPPPNIKIKINDITLDKKDCYLNEYWLPGHRREARGHIISGTQPETCHVTHDHRIDNDYIFDIVYTDTLKQGDLVSVYPLEGKQLYFIESKLVKL